MKASIKIGIIQNAPLTADLPNNLRSIVQGYRECLDHGADIVIASATALCGPRLASLASRRSFLRQTQDALKALSRELSSAPLLLGAYTTLSPLSEEEACLQKNERTIEHFLHTLDTKPCAVLVPYLIQKDNVTELSDGTTISLAGRSVYVDIYEGEVFTGSSNFDLMVHLADCPWYSQGAYVEDATRMVEACNNQTPTVWVQSVGSAGGTIYAGGSSLFNAEGKPLLRLPFFEEANRVASLSAKPQDLPMMRAEVMIERAITYGLSCCISQFGYSSVCLPLDHPNAPLLAAFCAEAIGAEHVEGITFGGNEKAAAIAAAIGIRLHTLDATPVLKAAGARRGTALAARLQAAMISNYAEEHNHLHLCALCRNDIMLGNFTPLAESHGQLAPLGGLLQKDVYELTQNFCTRYTGLCELVGKRPSPNQDTLIHLMADLNIAASDILACPDTPFSEDEVRFVQRRLRSSATKREMLPPMLSVGIPSQQLTIPPFHRLND